VAGNPAGISFPQPAGSLARAFRSVGAGSASGVGCNRGGGRADDAGGDFRQSRNAWTRGAIDMNTHTIGILFLKDLYLSRRPLFAYFAAGVACSAMSALPQQTLAFAGFVLILTVAIGSGMHLLGELLISEGNDQTRTFILSLPVSVLDYSIAKMAVVLTAFLIPWFTMLASSVVLTAVLPWGKLGAVPVLVVVFVDLLWAFS